MSMITSEFYRSLEEQNSLNATLRILECFPEQMAATIGLDKRPQVRPVRFRFEKDGALYFNTIKCSRFYAELCADPHIQIAVYDPGTLTTFTLSATVFFTEDNEIIEACMSQSAFLRKQWGTQPEMVIAFFLRDVKAELRSLSEEIPDRSFMLDNSDNAPVGITIRKKKELKERLTKLLEERAGQGREDLSGDVQERRKLYDGALALMAEAGKKLWPRMNVQILEPVLLYETYNEREDYMRRAGRRIGNAVIDQPEDFTWLLSDEVLSAD